MERYVIIAQIRAVTGCRRAARRVIGQAIREGLKVKKWYLHPHNVEYVSEAHAGGDTPGGRYTFEASPAELQQVMNALKRICKEAGWGDGVPVDMSVA